MKSSKTSLVGIDEDIKLTHKEKLGLGLIIGSPLILYGVVSLLGVYYKKTEPPREKPPYTYESYLQKPEYDINLKPRKMGPNDRLIPESTVPGGIVLDINGAKIYTGLSSEDIINQLSLDYQDLYDYYGGAEELY